MKEMYKETVGTLLDAAITATDAEEAKKYADAAKTVTESYKLVADAELADKKADLEHEVKMSEIQSESEGRKATLELEDKKLELDEKKWYDLTPKELAMNKKDKIIAALQTAGGIATAIVGGYIAYRAGEKRNETIKRSIDAATNYSQTDVLNGKPLEVIDKANKIADD